MWVLGVLGTPVTDLHRSLFCFSPVFSPFSLSLSLSLILSFSHPLILSFSFSFSFKMEGELWARAPVLTPVPVQTNHSSSHRRQFQTGQTPEKSARTFRVHGPCLETLLRMWHTHVRLLGPRLETATMETNPKYVFCLSLSGSLGLWDLWSEHGHAKFEGSFSTRVLNWQVRQRTVMARGAQSETEGGMTFHQSRLWAWVAAPDTTTDNRTDCDHARHRPATETPTKKS